MHILYTNTYIHEPGSSNTLIVNIYKAWKAIACEKKF